MQTPNLLFLIPIFCAASASCGKPDFGSVYQKSTEYFGETTTAIGQGNKVIGKSGKTEIDERNFFYAGADGEVVQPQDLRAMDQGIRSLTIRKELLRKIVVMEGIKEGIFSSSDALGFILPRLEKILEEYYYYKKANMGALTAQTEKIAPDDEALAALLKSDAKLLKTGAGIEDLRRERARLVRKIAQRRAEEERQRIIMEILKKHPPLEVLP